MYIRNAGEIYAFRCTDDRFAPCFQARYSAHALMYADRCGTQYGSQGNSLRHLFGHKPNLHRPGLMLPDLWMPKCVLIASPWICLACSRIFFIWLTSLCHSSSAIFLHRTACCLLRHTQLTMPHPWRHSAPAL